MGKLPSFDEMQAQSDIPDWAKDQPANKGTSKDDWRPVGHDDWQQFPEAPSASKGELPDAPWAEFQRADQAKPPFDPNKPYEAWPGTPRNAARELSDADVGLGTPRNTRPITSGAEAAVQGAITGATAGWRPELEGLSRASGLPEYGGVHGYGFRIPIGAARLAWEHATGQRGPATEQYEAASNAIRQRQEKLRGEHPWVYGGGELAGAVVPMLMAPEATGPGIAARMALRSAPAMAQPAVHPKVSKKRARAERSRALAWVPSKEASAVPAVNSVARF